MAHVLGAYALPAGGALIEVYRIFFPSELPKWVGDVGSPLLTYAITFAVAAFMFKRSLMLGASERAIYFPGAIPENQGYSNETAILATVGIRQREWPFDIALSLTSAAIAFLFAIFPLLGLPPDIALPFIWHAIEFLFGFLYGFFNALFKPVLSDNLVIQEHGASAILVTIFVTSHFLAFYRRRKTGRLLVPMFFALIALIFYLVRREGRILKQSLAVEVNRGLITQRQLDTAISAFRRTGWVASAIGDDRLFGARRRFLRSVAKLGFCHWHARRAAEAGVENVNLPLITQFQDEVSALRDKVE
jgi:hypothetical protein